MDPKPERPRLDSDETSDPCPNCYPSGVAAGPGKRGCFLCGGSGWLPDDCLVCGEHAVKLYRGRADFPSCGSARCDLKMQGGIDAHEHGSSR